MCNNIDWCLVILCVMECLECVQIVHCVIIYDIIRKLLETFSERDVELLLLLLKSEPLLVNAD